MRKIGCAWLAVWLLLAACPCALAAETPDRLVYEGQEAELCHGLERVRGVVYVSLADLAAVLGAQYRLDPGGRSCVLRWGEQTLRMTLGSGCAYLGSETRTFEAAPMGRNGVIRLPLADVAAALGLGYMEDGDAAYLTRWAGKYQPEKGISLPILMYHAVSDEVWGGSALFVKPAEMEKQLQYLSEHGYTTVTFEDMPRIHEIEKPVFLTFDDGYRDNYTELYPLLQKYGAKATIFVITNAIGNELYLTEEMIAEMSASGLVSIQSHTDTHPNLRTLKAEELEQEMELSLRKLLRITGKQPFVVSYPEGRYNDAVLKAAEKWYAYGVKMNGGTYVTGSNLYRMNRIYISRDMGVGTFAAKIRT